MVGVLGGRVGAEVGGWSDGEPPQVGAVIPLARQDELLIVVDVACCVCEHSCAAIVTECADGDE